MGYIHDVEQRIYHAEQHTHHAEHQLVDAESQFYGPESRSYRDRTRCCVTASHFDRGQAEFHAPEATVTASV